MTYLRDKAGDPAVTEVTLTEGGDMAGYIVTFRGTHTAYLDDHVSLGARRTIAEAHALIDAALEREAEQVREHNERVLRIAAALDAA